MAQQQVVVERAGKRGGRYWFSRRMRVMSHLMSANHNASMTLSTMTSPLVNYRVGCPGLHTVTDVSLAQDVRIRRDVKALEGVRDACRSEAI